MCLKFSILKMNFARPDDEFHVSVISNNVDDVRQMNNERSDSYSNNDEGLMIKPNMNIKEDTLVRDESLTTPSPQLSSNIITTLWSKLSGKSSTSRIFCRICYDDEGILISPCKCKGSMGLIHRECLEKWLSSSPQLNTSSSYPQTGECCELCGFRFQVEKSSPSFTEWLCFKKFSSESDSRPTLIGDFCCFLLLTPMAILSAYLCAMGAIYYLQIEKNEAIGLITLATFLIFIYILWMILTIRYHRIMWMKWKKNNQHVQLINYNVGQVA